MPADKEPLVNLDEIARLLESNEGPPDARRKPVAGPSRSSVRWTGAVAAGALLVGSGLGFGVGSSLTERGNAAGSPVGLGFLPAQGWSVIQSGQQAARGQPTLAIAASVPFRADDIEAVRDYYWVPFSTLSELPARGIVIIASFTSRGEQPWRDRAFPERALPLQLGDAEPVSRLGRAIRPARPLGSYQLRGALNGQNVDVEIYFGTRRPSEALVAAAQNQLERLVVRSSLGQADASRNGPRLRPMSNVQGAAPARVIDQTFVCSTSVIGGAREISATARRGAGRDGRGSWQRVALARITTGGSTSGGVTNPSILNNSLAWVTGGQPRADATLIDHPQLSSLYRVRAWGTLALNRRLCRPSTLRVSPSTKGLSGGAAGSFGDEWDCATPRRVVVRLRATLRSAAPLKTHGQFLRTTVPVKTAYLAVRNEAGKSLVYAEVDESGRSRLFTAPRCFPS